MNKAKKYILIHTSKLIISFFSLMIIVMSVTSIFDVTEIVRSSISYFFWFSFGMFIGSIWIKNAIKSLKTNDEMNTFLGIKPDHIKRKNKNGL